MYPLLGCIFPDFSFCTDRTAMMYRTDIGKMDSSLFLRFNRISTLVMTALPGQAIRLDFPSPGLRQVPPSIGCPGQNVYTITARQATRDTAVGTFCPNGSVSGILVLSESVVTVEAPSQVKMDPLLFNASFGPDIKSKFDSVARNLQTHDVVETRFQTPF